ncbi:Mitochondrial tRNA-specific 2-thiouridylase 1 [Chionoecetes opilio]|uniref:Mitochondrial tRNA-specific 2-thiouridylase 1 n=1 Tax=Chionoecetes opilio TaxID=41210 RepID=A0A8J4YG38_CHIOP|nr:Mitochondrial tRNA-specific 2-thiouridylase 1 [Chionoecetes opilio]
MFCFSCPEAPEALLRADLLLQVSGTDHPALFASTLFTEPVFWIHSPPSELYSQGQLECHFRFQNTASLTACVLTTNDANPWHRSPTQSNMVVSLAKPLRAITPGQSAFSVQRYTQRRTPGLTSGNWLTQPSEVLKCPSTTPQLG